MSSKKKFSSLRINKHLGLCSVILIIFFASASESSEKKIDLLRQKAKQNDVEAQLKLANQYFYGSKRKQNYTLAVHWFRKAAKQNSPDAQYNLAICIQYGLGIKRNPYQAFVWYGRAAVNGSKPAKYNLAMCYVKGIPEQTK
ncbi:MAG: sel1 repeat family protein, partial [Victivallaceae bacterium]|nr:sel1 repeat family protein [Victivallaceae bacterium]